MKGFTLKWVGLLAGLGTIGLPICLNIAPLLPDVQVLAQTVNEQKLEADLLMEKGKQEAAARQYLTAAQSFARALEIYREIEDSEGIESAHLELIPILISQPGIDYNDYFSMIDIVQISGRLIPFSSDSEFEAEIDAKIPYLKTKLEQLQSPLEVQVRDKVENGDYVGAIRDLEQILSSSMPPKDKPEEMTALAALMALGWLHANQSDYAKSISYLEQGLQLTEGLDITELRNADVNEDRIVTLRGLTSDNAFTIIGNSWIELSIADKLPFLLSLGEISMHQNNAVKALTYFETALQTSNTYLSVLLEKGAVQEYNMLIHPLSMTKFNALLSIGRAHLILGQYQQALASINQIFQERLHEIRNLKGISAVNQPLLQTMSLQAMILLNSGNREGAKTKLREILNQTGSSASGSMNFYQTSLDHLDLLDFSSAQVDLNMLTIAAQILQGLMIEEGRYEAALEVSESNRARLLENLISGEPSQLLSSTEIANFFDNSVLRDISDPDARAESKEEIFQVSQGLPMAQEMLSDLIQSNPNMFANPELYYDQLRRELAVQQQLEQFEDETQSSVQHPSINSPNPQIDTLTEVAKLKRSTIIEFSLIPEPNFFAEKPFFSYYEHPYFSFLEDQSAAAKDGFGLLQGELSFFGKKWDKQRELKLVVYVVKPSGEIAYETIDLTTLKTSISNLIADTREADLRVSSRARSEAQTSGQSPNLAPGALVRFVDDAPNSPPWRVESVNLTEGTLTVRLDTIPVPITRPIAEVVDDDASSQVNHSNLQTLHQLLIEPIAHHLPKNPDDRVIFVPQGDLFMVPFAALQDAQGKYLIEKHTILTAPSIQILERTHALRNEPRTYTQEALIVGDPTMPVIPGTNDPLQQLPGAQRSAQQISALFNNTQPLIGQAANEAAIIAQLPNTRFAHLATHGMLDDFFGFGAPGVLALAPSNPYDGFLTATEIQELDLQTELVVLSACDTGRGEITGDGVVGLSRSFIAAGVPSLVVSLWKVPDDETTSLMVEFYRNFRERNLDKAQALRQAMLTMLEQHPHPRNWAAFTLIGEAE